MHTSATTTSFQLSALSVLWRQRRCRRCAEEKVLGMRILQASTVGSDSGPFLFEHVKRLSNCNTVMTKVLFGRE